MIFQGPTGFREIFSGGTSRRKYSGLDRNLAGPFYLKHNAGVMGDPNKNHFNEF